MMTQERGSPDIDVVGGDENRPPPLSVEALIGAFGQRQPAAAKPQCSEQQEAAAAICKDAKFASFRQFEQAFEHWKQLHCHPFRSVVPSC